MISSRDSQLLSKLLRYSGGERPKRPHPHPHPHPHEEEVCIKGGQFPPRIYLRILLVVELITIRPNGIELRSCMSSHISSMKQMRVLVWQPAGVLKHKSGACIPEHNTQVSSGCIVSEQSLDIK